MTKWKSHILTTKSYAFDTKETQKIGKRPFFDLKNQRKLHSLNASSKTFLHQKFWECTEAFKQVILNYSVCSTGYASMKACAKNLLHMKVWACIKLCSWIILNYNAIESDWKNLSQHNDNKTLLRAHVCCKWTQNSLQAEKFTKTIIRFPEGSNLSFRIFSLRFVFSRLFKCDA